MGNIDLYSSYVCQPIVSQSILISLQKWDQWDQLRAKRKFLNSPRGLSSEHISCPYFTHCVSLLNVGS